MSDTGYIIPVLDATGLGMRIRTRRREIDLTMDELASRAGLGRPHINDIERGRGNPRFETLNKIAAALGVSAMDLLAPTPSTALRQQVVRLVRTLPDEALPDAIQQLQFVARLYRNRSASAPRPGGRGSVFDAPIGAGTPQLRSPGRRRKT